MIRRDFLRNGTTGTIAALLPSAVEVQAQAPRRGMSAANFDVRAFGAVGDGKTIDTSAVNRAIQAAATAGGGTVHFPAGVYACYTIRLKSHVSLFLDAGATILAASVPDEGTTSGGYDAAGPPPAWAAYQDFGHGHWPNSLIWGDGLENVSIYGAGLIWGKGLSAVRRMNCREPKALE